VVADAAAVVLALVHDLVDGQRLVAGHRVDQGLVVGQGGALDGVAVVQQHRVGEFGTGLVDQGGHALIAERGVLGQLEVVVAHYVGVQVGGLQQGQAGLGVGRHHRASAGAAAGDQSQGGCAQQACGAGVAHRMSSRF